MAEKQSLADKVRNNEAKEAEAAVSRTSAVRNIVVLNDGSKDKQISAKVNDINYEMFTQINKILGISNNSALNMLINKYVREHKNLIDEQF